MLNRLSEIGLGIWEIDHLDQAHALYFRMLSLGFSKGAKIQVLGAGALYKLRLRQSILILRKEEASAIFVSQAVIDQEVMMDQQSNPLAHSAQLGQEK